jgi:CubicO group peptidase (beta-lactamase class C family)
VLDSAFLQACEAAAFTWEVPALAVGVDVAGKTETAGLGCDADARFRVASITKPFTALLTLGLLDPEQPTGVWASDVRVRHLLSHMSGYDCELAGVDNAVYDDEPDPLRAQLPALAGVRRWVGLEQCWSYSNAGYWLAGHLAAEAAGARYEDALAAHVLRPLGLGATSFDAPPDLPGTGPDANDGSYPRARRPSGGLISNVADLLRFGRGLLAEPQMRIVHGKPVAGVYGLGLGGERVGGVEVWGHAGSWGGYQTILLTVPDRDAVFVGLTNGSRGGKALDELEDLFFERLLGARRTQPQEVVLPDDALEELAGSYANSDLWIEVSYAVGGLSVRVEEGEFHARPIGERTFEITEGDFIRERFDFPLEGFVRFGVRLAERVA